MQFLADWVRLNIKEHPNLSRLKDLEIASIDKDGTWSATHTEPEVWAEVVGRDNRDSILSLIRQHALSSEDKAKVLLPTVQWLCNTSVMRDKAHGMETLILIQQTYPQISME